MSNRPSILFMVTVLTAELVTITLLILLSRPTEPNGLLLCDSHELKETMTCRPYSPEDYALLTENK